MPRRKLSSALCGRLSALPGVRAVRLKLATDHSCRPCRAPSRCRSADRRRDGWIGCSVPYTVHVIGGLLRCRARCCGVSPRPDRACWDPLAHRQRSAATAGGGGEADEGDPRGVGESSPGQQLPRGGAGEVETGSSYAQNRAAVALRSWVKGGAEVDDDELWGVDLDAGRFAREGPPASRQIDHRTCVRW